MLIKDKDILAEKDVKEQPIKVKQNLIDKKNMQSAWGDAFDYFIRGITERYLLFSSRASRLEFWGFYTVFGFILLALVALGRYVDIPLALYFSIASFIPATAVITRRLHDINKNAMLYLGIAILIPLLTFFIGYWVFLLILLWGLLLVYLLSKATVENSDIYGEPSNEDESYGNDTIHIIHKFRFLTLVSFAVLLGIAYIDFDNWSRQAEYKAINESIMEKIEQGGHQAGLNADQIKAAQDVMKTTLKSWDGKEVQPDDIEKAITNALKKIKNSRE